jgi:hypothetical protein
MNSSEFVAMLGEACPGRQELLIHGLDDDEIESVQKMFYAPKRLVGIEQATHHEIGKLLNFYDCSSVEIGAFTCSFSWFGRNNRLLRSGPGTSLHLWTCCFAESRRLVACHEMRIKSGGIS